MKKFETIFIFLLVLLALSLSDVGATAQTEEIEIFTARIDTGERLKMIVERWTTTEENQKLRQAYDEGGSEALIKEMQNTIVGYAWFPAKVTETPRWQICLASSKQEKKGLFVQLLTIGRMYMGYPEVFFAIEFILDEKREGQGTIKSSKIASINKKGDIELEANLVYKLIKVTKIE